MNREQIVNKLALGKDKWFTSVNDKLPTWMMVIDGHLEPYADGSHIRAVIPAGSEEDGLWCIDEGSWMAKRIELGLEKKVEEEEIVSESKHTNPKDAIGSSKMPFHLWPIPATALGSLALLDGALKYGRSNWRHAGVRASIYVDACQRHLGAWFEGEDVDPDSGISHLGHALACLAILADAQHSETLNDDRMTRGDYRALIDKLTPEVARLQKHHADKDPKHYTIKDE